MVIAVIAIRALFIAHLLSFPRLCVCSTHNMPLSIYNIRGQISLPNISVVYSKIQHSRNPNSFRHYKLATGFAKNILLRGTDDQFYRPRSDAHLLLRLPESQLGSRAEEPL